MSGAHFDKDSFNKQEGSTSVVIYIASITLTYSIDLGDEDSMFSVPFKI